jgi:hypothetical protein
MNRLKEKTFFNKKWLLLAALPLTAAVWKLTDEYTSGYYHNPLAIKPELAANFGEVRENHFHMGLDIRTNGKENLPVYATTDGYVSRVTIEETGYGKAVYITHTNGTTTVYAHLNHFAEAVEKYVHEKQYHDECWRQDIVFPPAMFPVKRGERIALSGNTGTSEGPHLHFEIRDTKTGDNVNPLLNGISITDHIAPTINALYWYNANSSIYISAANEIDIKERDDEYTSVQKIITVNSCYVSFGIAAVDKNTASKYRLGIYKALLYLDDSLQFSFALNRFKSADTRYVNACIDYSNWVQYSKCIQLLRKLPGNRLPVFEGSPGNGIIHLHDNKMHRLKILVSDASGNTSILRAIIQYSGANPKEHTLFNNTQVLLPGRRNRVVTQNATIDFGPTALYDTLPIHVTEEPGSEVNTASRSIFLHEASVPVHDSFRVSIKTTLPAASPLRNHVVIMLTNEKHNIIVKGTWRGDYMTGYCTELGTVQLVIDTVSPAVALQEGDNCSFTNVDKALHILFKDNMGEAAFFRAELDGHWVLFEKRDDRFTYYFDEYCKPGMHKLQVIAGDRAGNVTRAVFAFTFN